MARVKLNVMRGFGICVAVAAMSLSAVGGEPKGGEAGVKGDLKVVIAPAKAVFARGEALAFRYTFTNVGDGRFALYNKLFDYQYSDHHAFEAAASMVVTNLGTNKTWRVCCMAELLRKRSNFPTPTLAKGESFEGEFKFENHLQFESHPGSPEAELPPGRYRLAMTWIFPRVEASKVRWWQGEIQANAAEFEIGDKARGASIDDMIRAGRVVEGKAAKLGEMSVWTFCQSEAAVPTPDKAVPLILGVRVKNTGEKDLSLDATRLVLLAKWGNGQLMAIGINQNGVAKKPDNLIVKPGEHWDWIVADAKLAYIGNPRYLAFIGSGFLGGQFLELRLKGASARIGFAVRFEQGRPEWPASEPVFCQLGQIAAGEGAVNRIAAAHAKVNVELAEAALMTAGIKLDAATR